MVDLEVQDLKKKSNIKMLFPYSDNRPFIPNDYDCWIRNTKGFKKLILNICDFEKLNFEEFDRFLYIKNKDNYILRYDIKDKIFQCRLPNNTNIYIQTIEQLVIEFKKHNINFIIIEII